MNMKKDPLIYIDRKACDGLTQKEIVQTIFEESDEKQRAYLTFLKNHLEGRSSIYSGLETNLHEAFHEIAMNYPSKITSSLLLALLKTEIETNNFQSKDFWSIIFKKAQDDGIEKKEIKEYLLKNKNVVGILALDETLTSDEVEVFIEYEDYLQPENLLELFLKYDNVFQKEFFDRKMKEDGAACSFSLSNKALFFFRKYIEQPDFVINHGHDILNTISKIEVASESYGYSQVGFNLANLFWYLDDVFFLEKVLEAGEEKIDVEIIFENCPSSVKNHEKFPELLIKYNQNVIMNGASRSNVLVNLTFDLQCNKQVLKYLNFRKDMEEGLSEQEYLQKIEKDWTQFIAIPRELKESASFVEKVENILEKEGLDGNINFWLMLPTELKIEKNRLKKYIINGDKEVENILRNTSCVLRLFEGVEINNDEVFFELLDALIPVTNKILCDVDYYLDCFKNETFYEIFKDSFLSGIIDNAYSLDEIFKTVLVQYQEMKMKEDTIGSETITEKKKIRKF